MNWRIYGILIIFGLFVLLLIVNPNISCFGKRLKSPFYPLFRNREKERRAKKQRALKDERRAGRPGVHGVPQDNKTEDYGFRLD